MHDHQHCAPTRDGIGPEIVSQAQRVLEAVGKKSIVRLRFKLVLSVASQLIRLGIPSPQKTVAACRKADAILLGAVGGPKWDDPAAKTRPEAGLLRIRKELGLFANLRPIQTYSELVDASPFVARSSKGPIFCLFEN